MRAVSAQPAINKDGTMAVNNPIPGQSLMLGAESSYTKVRVTALSRNSLATRTGTAASLVAARANISQLLAGNTSGTPSQGKPAGVKLAVPLKTRIKNAGYTLAKAV
jgi:hypothetical protein